MAVQRESLEDAWSLSFEDASFEGVLRDGSEFVGADVAVVYLDELEVALQLDFLLVRLDVCADEIEDVSEDAFDRVLLRLESASVSMAYLSLTIFWTALKFSEKMASLFSRTKFELISK